MIDGNFTDRTSCIFVFSMLVCTGYVGCDFAKYDVYIFNMIQKMGSLWGILLKELIKKIGVCTFF